jgi:AraC-like DNA-binding protein
MDLVTAMTVSAGYAQALIEVAVAHGADRAALLAATGFDPAACPGPDTRVPFETFKMLMRTAATACKNPALALHFGAESRFVDMSIVGLIAHASATMGEAFAQVNRYARLVVEVDGHQTHERFAIVRRDGETWMEDRRRNPDDFPELTESTFARFIADTRRSFGAVPFAKCICFTHAAPAHAEACRRILGVPVAFGCNWNAIAIHDSWLALPLPGTSWYVFGIFSDRAQALLEDLQRSQSLAAQVEAALIPLLHSGDTGMDRIARQLGTSRTSLYRRLKAEGASFDSIVDQLRHRMALHYLAGKKVSVGETAYLVGFTDPASFSRAFKRWTGSAPRALR